MSDFPLAPRSAQLLFEDAFRLFNTRDDKIGSIMAASGVVNTIWYSLTIHTSELLVCCSQ
jgi:hypothetical protein